MKKTLLGACAILLLATLQFGQGLGYQKLIAHVTGGVRWSQCAFDSSGILWVVFEEDTDRGHPVWVVSYDGTTTSTPFNVTGDLDVRGERPGIGAGRAGNVAVVYGVDAGDKVFLRVFDTSLQAWQPLELVAEGYGWEEANVAVDDNGNIHVVWFHYAQSQVWTRSKINGVWSDIRKISGGTAKDATVAVGPNGTAICYWREKGAGGNYKNFYSTRTPTSTWTTLAAVNEGGNSASHPSVTVSVNNEAYAAWGNIDPANENGADMRVKRIIPDGEKQYAIEKYMAHYPRIAVDKNGVVHIVCQIGGGDFGSGLRYTNNSGGTWAEPQTWPASMNKVAGIATDAFGNVAACQSSWNSGGGSDIFCYSINALNAIPLPIADFTYSPTSGYPPLSVTFTATQAFGPNGAEVNYDWTFGDGGTATGRTATHVFNLSGTFDVRLRIVDNLGRQVDKIKSVEVLKTTPLPPQGLTATIGMTSFWKNPEITYTLNWAINPSNVPEHIQGYAIYMKENNGTYTKLLAVSSTTLTASFEFTDLKKKRAFAVSTLGYGGSESALVYFQ